MMIESRVVESWRFQVVIVGLILGVAAALHSPRWDGEPAAVKLNSSIQSDVRFDKPVHYPRLYSTSKDDRDFSIHWDCV